MVRKEHLTPEGLKKILSIKAAMNGNGLSDKLKKAFPDVISITRPTRDNDKHLIQLSKTYYVGCNLVKQEIYDSSPPLPPRTPPFPLSSVEERGKGLRGGEGEPCPKAWTSPAPGLFG